MSERKRRVFERELKLSAVARVMAGEGVPAVAAELGVPAGLLYKWHLCFRRSGPNGLRCAGRPRGCWPAGEPEPAQPAELQELAAARKRLAELERKIGQQQVELDFFRQALRQVGGTRRPSDGPGVPASTRSSRR